MNSVPARPVLNTISQVGILPILRGRLDPVATLDIAMALVEAGLPIFEISLVSPNALQLVTQLINKLPNNVLVGVGTVRRRDDAERALDAGAAFLVSPGFDTDVVALAASRKTLHIPGVFTPTEMELACQTGADVLKLFPAGPLGPKYVRSVLTPLPNLHLIPTGGITLANAGEFIAAGASAVGVGGALIGEGNNPKQVWLLAARLVEIVRAAKKVNHRA